MSISTIPKNRNPCDECGPGLVKGKGFWTYFALAIFGFSFWFMMAVPFASHRETYWWIAKVSVEDFSYALSFIASTYRPFHQAVSWLGFVFLDPAEFPTNAFRQALLQLLVYGFFCFAVPTGKTILAELNIVINQV